MGIPTPIHEPCHLQLQDGPLNIRNKAPKKKRVSFNGNVRIQMFETENNNSDDDFWNEFTSTADQGGRRVPRRRTIRTIRRRRKPKFTVQRVLAQQETEQRKMGYVNPYSLADVSVTTSSIFAEEAHMAALDCAHEIEEYLYGSDTTMSDESEASDFEDILL